MVIIVINKEIADRIEKIGIPKYYFGITEKQKNIEIANLLLDNFNRESDKYIQELIMKKERFEEVYNIIDESMNKCRYFESFYDNLVYLIREEKSEVKSFKGCDLNDKMIGRLINGIALIKNTSFDLKDGKIFIIEKYYTNVKPPEGINYNLAFNYS